MEDNIYRTILIIILLIVLILLILYIVYMLIGEIKTSQLRKDYIKTLNKHDKKVITDYFTIYYKLFKKRGK